MKKQFATYMLGISVIAFSTTASAVTYDDDKSFSNDPNLQSVTVNGDATMDNVAGDVITVNGDAELDQAKFESLTVNGDLTYENLSVMQKTVVDGDIDKGDDGTFSTLSVAGDVNIKDTHAENITIYGDAKLKGSVISGATAVFGNLEGKGTTFNNVVINGKSLVLDGSTVSGDITFKKNEWHPYQIQKLILKDGSKVEGSVVFLSGRGEISVDKTSHIEGKVSGLATAAEIKAGRDSFFTRMKGKLKAVFARIL